MLRYDWKKICKYAGNSSSRVVIILKAMIHPVMPKNRFDPIYRYYYMDFTGLSFLINPYSLLASRGKYTDKEIADYLGLASFRNLAEYKLTGKLTLDLSHSPLGKDAINKNRLLHLEDNNIYFLFEDYKGDK